MKIEMSYKRLFWSYKDKKKSCVLGEAEQTYGRLYPLLQYYSPSFACGYNSTKLHY